MRTYSLCNAAIEANPRTNISGRITAQLGEALNRPDTSMNIYGEYTDTGTRTPITIFALDDQECEFQTPESSITDEGLFDLSIGAIGPFAAVAEICGSQRYRARFREPLDPRIIAHFAPT